MTPSDNYVTPSFWRDNSKMNLIRLLPGGHGAQQAMTMPGWYQQPYGYFPHSLPLLFYLLLIFSSTRLLGTLVEAVERQETEIIGMEVTEPECAPCIVSTGKRFLFIWFQLNTVDMADVNDGGGTWSM